MKSEGIKQLGKLLSEIISNLKDYPVFLFGIASMLMAIVSIWIIAFASISLPESLNWFPYALLLFGILVIIVSPANSRSNNFAKVDAKLSETNSSTPVDIRWIFSGVGKLNIILSGLNLLWGIYFGNKLGYGLNTLLNSYSQSINIESAKMDYGLIIGNTTIGLLVSLGIIAVAVWYILGSYEKNVTCEGQLFLSGILLANFIFEAIFILAVSVLYSPLIAATWWLSQGNFLITIAVSILSIPMAIVIFSVVFLYFTS